MTAKLLAEARRLCEVAEIEVSTLIDLRSTSPEDRAAAAVHSGLERALLKGALQPPAANGRGAGRPRDLVRTIVVSEVNRRSGRLLRSALAAFRTAMAQDVVYEFPEANFGEDLEPFTLDPPDLPFIQFHDEALEAALELRSLDEDIQFGALQMADALVARRTAEFHLEDEAESEVLARVHHAEQRLLRCQKGLPAQALTLGERFVDAMDVGSAHPSCIPVCARTGMSAQESEELAAAYSRFGSNLRYAMNGRALGKPASRLEATTAWLNYRGCGQALGDVPKSVERVS